MSKYNYNHDCPFEAFITNLGKYNEGELIGEWVKFPTTKENIQEVFKRIGIGSEDEFGQPYEEWFISDYDVYVDGLYHLLGEYESLVMLNTLANSLEELSDSQYKKFLALMEEGSYSTSLSDVMDMIINIECFEILEDVRNSFDLGYYYINEIGVYDLSNFENLSHYIDYERFGEDIATEEGGIFTNNGYVAQKQFYKTTYSFNDIKHEVKEKNLKYNSDVIYLCKLPSKDIIEKEFGKIVNDDIVLTKERIKHIEDRRKDDADFIKIHLLETIKDYDFIIKARKNCVQFIKSFEKYENLIVVILSLENENKANSVLSGIKTNKKELKRLIKNKCIIDSKR